MMLRTTFGLLLAAGTVFGRQASSLNVTVDEAAEYGCGSACYQILQLTQQVDLGSVGTDFDFDFYDTAANFSKSQPGDLLKLQVLDPAGLDVKSGTTVFRIQYTSKDFDGTPVPVTGFVAFPYAPPGNRKDYPLAAYAHGTIGVYRGCAPSTGPGLFDYDSWSLLVDRGYAVVATDYAGLGNNHTEHKYCTFPAHANDLYYSVVAARKAFGRVLSSDWMSVGHSQGGGAVWKLAESKMVTSNKGGAGRYLGTVALAPATRIIDMALVDALPAVDTAKIHEYVITGELGFLAVGLQRFMPSYNLSILAEPMRKRIALSEKAQMCTTSFMGLTLDLPLSDLISTHHIKTDRPLLEKWQNATAPGSGARSHHPIMVVQGLNDTSVLPATTVRAVRTSCSAGNEVHFRQLPGMDHSPVIPAAAPEWLQWMYERFEGVPTCGRCSNITRQPINLSHIKAPPEFPLDEVLGAIESQ